MILHDSSWKQQNPPFFFLKTCEQGTLRSPELIAWVKAIQHLSVWGVTTKRVMGRYSKPQPGMARDEMMRCAICAICAICVIPPRCFPKHPTATSRRKPSDAITSLPTIFYYLFKETTWKRPIIEMKWIFFQHENTKRSQRGHEEIESSATKPWLCHLTRLGTTKKTVHETKRQNTK